MAKYTFLFFMYVCFIFAFIIMLVCDANEENDKKLHIVYMGSLPNGASYSPTSHHLRMLQQVIADGEDVANYIIRSYHRSFNGFSAMLTDQQREKLTNMEGVVSVFPSKTLHLQTTRSWDFMGFHESSVQRNLNTESDVIIGVIDSGVWPESDSFKDEGFGPIPKKWKGSCEGGKNFTCNNKIIGARHYFDYFGGSESARDDIGHGSHTASIAAGNKVTSASFYGMAEGIARGGVPSARIGVYSVCQNGCPEDSILHAFDDAIADGVDLITISMAPSILLPFEEDSIAIGSFHAMNKGILTVNSAGNSGPGKGSTYSVAPWLFSVAASTIDRRIVDKVSLGNGLTLVGKAINTFSSNGTKVPLVSGSFASYPNCSGPEAESCSSICLDPTLAKGKILLCASDDGYSSAYRAGVYGSLTKSEVFEANVVSYPSVPIDSKAYALALSYANSTDSPQAEIMASEAVTNTNAPIVADFSGRGPNAKIPEIMKPDISAPGVEILAAFSPIASPSNSGADKRSVKYNIISGTSMSAPHVAGIAAYVKSFHPDWSPAAIKSSIMTTARVMNGSEDHKEFAYGSGHVDPVRAINPGLVFDLSKDDYVNLLCNIGYNTSRVRLISGDSNSTCASSTSQRSKVKDINYPSIAIRVQPMKPFVVNFTRSVTNVGFANSTYKASILQHLNLNITVVPQVLSFSSLTEKQSFTVNVVGGSFSDQSVLSSSLLWTDGTHSVRCPIVLDVSHDA